MKIEYDEKADAIYIRLGKGDYKKSEEIKEGIILDYDKRGKIIGIEILDVSKKLYPSFRIDFLKNKKSVSAFNK